MKTTTQTTKTLAQLETAARDALAGRGVLHVSRHSLYGYGSAVIHTASMTPADAHSLAASIPGFVVVSTFKTSSGATSRGYMTGAR